MRARGFIPPRFLSATMLASAHPVPGVEITGSLPPAFQEILTAEAMAFVADLSRAFEPGRQAVLGRRVERQAQLDAGVRPDFPPETAEIRTGDWTITPVPKPLQDRRVELTGSVDRKTLINGLNSGAKTFMADFEDALSPTWENLIQGQINVRDAANRSIAYIGPTGKIYTLNPHTATLIVRPRGWHLPEKHVLVDDRPVSASLFDFGLFLFHSGKTLLAAGTGPYFYLPKLEGRLETRLWNDVFLWAEDRLGFARGTIRATVLIETILAAFEMDEILYELRDHAAGLNCGRWDYIFSCIKKFRADRNFVLADRSRITMTTPFMRAYTLLAIKTAHRRGVHAIGGMAAQLPVKDDPVANGGALARVRADKDREVADGHDGTWVAHPALVGAAMDAFSLAMPGPNQVYRQRDDVRVTAADLLAFGPAGPITREGVRLNVEISLSYLAAWLAGRGAVPIHGLMEDTATAEIARAQLWQWVHSPLGVLEGGGKVTLDMVAATLHRENGRLRKERGEGEGSYDVAAKLLEAMVADEAFPEFLTLAGYAHLS